jgi:glycosyltransferase involved in cell wall biosynthesis
MRVIHVAPTVFGDEGIYGGGERYPLELCRALAGLVDCRLVTFGSSTRRWREAGGLEHVVLERALLLRGHPAHPLGRGLFGATAGADIVHAHHMRSAPARAAALGALLRGDGRVVTDHGLGGGGWGGLLPKLWHVFACVSRYSARLLGVPASKTRVIYGGVDADRYRPAGVESRSGVLFVGRVTPHKGIDRLIRALPQGVQLTVVGTGGHDAGEPERYYPELLHRLAAGREVRFAGRVPDAELAVLYRRASVFVLPSVHVTCYGRWIRVPELLGLSVLEAMASGTPVVCSRVGGLSEVVSDGETGYLVEPGDVEQLAGRITSLLADRPLASRMGSAGRERVMELFTWERCAQRCADIYSELVAR